MTLPTALLTKPITHRGLHDVTDGRPENSVEALKAALNHGYGIEIDLQLSKVILNYCFQITTPLQLGKPR